ncbi:MAG: right-handed parallel beta-helix repeat-containing protein [Patescibacteria group bacterium]|nr:right-handed parallel beta-helix repeat-containing protein [Patescibacteria group bacterium]
MTKKIFFLTFIFLFAFIGSVQAETLASVLSGKILLQVEANGEAWYVNPENNERYFLNRPADAFQIMRDLGLGVSNENFDAWQGTAPARLGGKIILKVEDLGKAYYISPDDNELHYLGRPADAFDVMRGEGLGVTNLSLGTITVAEGYDVEAIEVTPPTAPEAPADEEEDENVEEGDVEEEEGSSEESEEEIEEEVLVSGTSVSGEISENTTWTLANSPYLIIDTLKIIENKKLTIEPGVAVEIYSGEGIADLGGISIIVSGTLEAQGTAENRINFAGNDSESGQEDWGAIEVINGGKLKFDYVDIENASTAVYGVNASNIEILNSVIKNNLNGVYLNCSATLEHNLIEDNNIGVVMANNTVSARDTGDYKNFNWLARFYYNTVTNNTGEDTVSSGIKFFDIKTSSYRFELGYNEIKNNTNGLLYKDTSIYSGIKVEYNNIFDNVNYAVYVDTVGSDLALEANWWGDAVSSNIDEMIFDYYDVAYDLAQVDYRPFKLAPIDL